MRTEVKTVDSFSLCQLNDEHGGFFLNSGPDPAALIEAARGLAKYYPDTDYAVKCGKETVWSSKMSNEDIKYRLVRKEGCISILVFPAASADLLITMGTQAAEKNPDWTLEVQDADLNIIWTNKKSAPGKAEDTPENG